MPPVSLRALSRVLADRAACRILVVLLLLTLAAVDVATSPDVSFLGFYFLPVLLAAWYLGTGEAIAVAIASVGVWIADDLFAHRHYASVSVPIWNRSVELGFFVFVAWIASLLRAALQREIAARMERLEHDMAIARDVQSALLPPPLLEGRTFSAAALCRQAFGVGGDAFDIVPLDASRVAVAVADVCGKGVPAALLMANFLAVFRGLLPLHSERLDVLASELSIRLKETLAPRRFITAFLAIAEDGCLRYVNAGHEPGLLLCPGGPGEIRTLDSTGPVLGLPKDLPFQEKRVAFPPGNVLLLFTDGLTEWTSQAGEEFGPVRVARHFREAGAKPPVEILASVFSAAEAHATGASPGDDVTLLCVSSRERLLATRQ